MFVGSASVGAFIVSGARGSMFWAMAFFTLTLVSIVGYYVIRKGEIELGEEEAPQPRPTAPVRQRADHQVRYAPLGVRRFRNTPPQAGAFESGLANAQAYAGLAVEKAGEVVYQAAVSYEADPKYGRLVVAFVLTIFTALGSMLGWWSAWKGYHLAGVLALLSGWFYARKHDKTSELLEFISKNKVAFWLGASVLMFFASLGHKWDPVLTLVLALSGIAALTTLLKGWEVVGKSLAWVYFNKEHRAWSSLAGSFSIGALVLIIDKYCTMRGIRVSPEFLSIGTIIFMVCVAVFSIAAIILMKGKKTN